MDWPYPPESSLPNWTPAMVKYFLLWIVFGNSAGTALKICLSFKKRSRGTATSIFLPRSCLCIVALQRMGLPISSCLDWYRFLGEARLSITFQQNNRNVASMRTRSIKRPSKPYDEHGPSKENKARTQSVAACETYESSPSIYPVSRQWWTVFYA
ncbi:hypothetical protein BV25DRAFT_1830750 [Artomyces pyxidatus]|uniref:Uncharacterized protein n=1 Tax=Artomyces pyxidatus TaxID=48021 RepID=A0ACB8SNL0_9AGAM|nr:hypothetical protein BV25DRAFT_1830750 [Artomyces pyxidatus]